MPSFDANLFGKILFLIIATIMVCLKQTQGLDFRQDDAYSLSSPLETGKTP